MSRTHSASLWISFQSLYNNLGLVRRLARREIEGRYKGSFFGFAWALLNPLVLLCLYTFVFGGVFKARWGDGEANGSGEYAVILYAGLILHGFFAECIIRAPGLIVGNPNFVKKIVFPLDLLAWAHHTAAWFHFSMSWVVLAIFQAIVFGSIPLTALMLPIVLVPCALYAQGVMWGLSALTVYFRDVAQVVGLLVTCLLFASPVLYPLEAVPAAFRDVLYLNPLTSLLEMFRSLMIWGKLPSLEEVLIQVAAASGVFYCGYFIFQRSRGGFSDVL